MSGDIFYLHDSSETTEDSFTVTASCPEIRRRSHPVTITVTIIPVNSEPPILIRNTGLEVKLFSPSPLNLISQYRKSCQNVCVFLSDFRNCDSKGDQWFQLNFDFPQNKTMKRTGWSTVVLFSDWTLTELCRHCSCPHWTFSHVMNPA